MDLSLPPSRFSVGEGLGPVQQRLQLNCDMLLSAGLRFQDWGKRLKRRPGDQQCPCFFCCAWKGSQTQGPIVGFRV